MSNSHPVAWGFIAGVVTCVFVVVGWVHRLVSTLRRDIFWGPDEEEIDEDEEDDYV